MARGDRDEDLRMDLHAGLHFIYKMSNQTRKDVLETAVTVLALLEELTENGMADAASLAERIGQKTDAELERIENHFRVQINEASDKYALTDLPQIPCAELMHLCQGRCCTLHFTLSRQDLDERVVKWTYSVPYAIAQRESDKYCVHSDPVTHGCGVYEKRPTVCRIYDCRQDKRIWVDYEQRIPVKV